MRPQGKGPPRGRDHTPNVICHHLNGDPQFKPIWKKETKYRPDRLLVLKEEIDKLLDVGFIWEVRYPNWLINVVMVKKPNGKWQVCVDFTNLNKFVLLAPNQSISGRDIEISIVEFP